MRPPMVLVQDGRGGSPWDARERVSLLLWHFAWPLLCQWTPKPLNGWRLLVLRLFGTEIEGRPFVHPRARLQNPWKVRLGAGCSLGDRANLYSLGFIEIGRDATVAQEAYLCTGSHAFERADMALTTAPIVVEDRAFIGARAFLMPGVRIGAGALVGAASVVTRDVAAGSRVAGNPARPLHSAESAERRES